MSHTHTICAIPGDGIGREVVPAAVAVLQRVVPDLRVEWAEAGYDTWRRTGEALPERTLALAQQADATLFGAVSSPHNPRRATRAPSCCCAAASTYTRACGRSCHYPRGRCLALKDHGRRLTLKGL